MNKKLFLLIPFILSLGACNQKATDSNTSKESIETSDELSESYEESIIPVSEDSEEQSESEDSQEEVDIAYATITPDLAPNDNNGGYPNDGELVTLEGSEFSYSRIMKNTGKFKPVVTIQFSNEGQGSGFIYNTTPIKGKLTITIMKNYVEYTQTDMSGELSVYVKDSLDTPLAQALEPVSKVEEDGKYIFTYQENVELHYYRIINMSEYAVYATSIIWSE